eukprot:gene13955-15411_t
MAPLKCSRIVSFTSQDQFHKVENVINAQNLKKWLCSKASVGNNLEVELELENSSRIEHINVGNHGSGFIEIQVGKSLWSKDRKFEELLPSVSLMTAAECKDWKNISKVFMFNISNFHGHVAMQEWDRVRIKCRQPLAKDKQFGLGFVELRAPDAKKTSNYLPKPCQELTRSFKNMVSKALSSSNGSASVSSNVMSRSAKCLQTALSKKQQSGVRQTSLTPKIIPKEDDDYLFDSDQEFESRNDDHHTPSSFQIINQKTVERKQTECNALSTGKMKSFVSNQFNMEVRDFLEELDIEKTTAKATQVSDIRKKMERLRGAKLNNAEKRVFFTLLGDALSKKIFRKDDAASELVFAGRGIESGKGSTAKEKTQGSGSGINFAREDETPPTIGSKEDACAGKRRRSGTERNQITCRNILCYDDDDVDRPPPRKRATAAPPLQFTKSPETITLEIHAAYCEGESILDGDDSQSQSVHDINGSVNTHVAQPGLSHRVNDGTGNGDKCGAWYGAAVGLPSEVNNGTSNEARNGMGKGAKDGARNGPASVTKNSISNKVICSPGAKTSTYNGTENASSSGTNNGTLNGPKSVQSITKEFGQSHAQTSPPFVNLSMETEKKEYVSDNKIDLSDITGDHGDSEEHPDLLITKINAPENVPCPVCMETFPPSYINYHVNLCLEFGS